MDAVLKAIKKLYASTLVFSSPSWPTADWCFAWIKEEQETEKENERGRETERRTQTKFKWFKQIKYFGSIAGFLLRGLGLI